MVAIDKNDIILEDTDDIKDFLIAFGDVFSRDDAFFELRPHPDGYNTIRIVRVLGDPTEADRLAREFDLEGWLT